MSATKDIEAMFSLSQRWSGHLWAKEIEGVKAEEIHLLLRD